ncbi:amidohydrolase [Aestuariicella hydrocarbonica]|uniref:Amidohydrolase n=1 Tax=Pseudomaricurvus hydrocarbonicus TaxID=1470433 RepID=A0A9E5JRZ9_9GAMM|nr:amidohydrolase [Aestuariicella hydrocarbonica]NHO64249.1 amidohydrolase [Aestuariicella hydrocarbonica]
MPLLLEHTRTCRLGTLVLVFNLFLLSGLLSGCSNDNNATIYTAQAIITMNPQQPRAEAIAVLNGKIEAVGDLATVTAAVAHHNPQVDRSFQGKAILPGFIEPHLHPYLAGILLPMEFITPHDWDMPGKQAKGVRGRDAYLEQLKNADQKLGSDEWLWTWGYHPYFHGELTRADLDQISTQRPIVVWHRSFHEIIVNTAVLNELELEDTAHPQVNFAEGHFYENGLYQLVPHIMPMLTSPFRYLGALRHARDIIHAGGVTTVSDGAFGTMDFDKEWLSMRFSSWNRSSSPFRFMVLADGKGLGKQMGHEQAKAFIKTLPEKNTGKVTFLPRQVKLFADGAAYSQLMQMRDGYLDGHHGEWLMTPDELETTARLYWRDDFQIHIHVNGDLGLDATLDIIEKLQREYPRKDHRTTVHHLAYARPEQAQRMAHLGVRVSANPYYVWALADKYAEVGLGPERAHHMVPLKSVVDAGVPLSFHSDFTMAPVQPLLLAWAAATRLTAEGRVVGADQRISLDDALKSITLDAASQLRMEDSIGSLSVGKNADFTILEQDPYTQPIERLKDIPVWGTVLEGKKQPIAADL